MKPYGRTTIDYGDTGCCPGHDFPRLRRWSGSYSSANSKRTNRKWGKIQNRRRRRKDKQISEAVA